MNYYNEFDPKAAAWLRELIAAGHIPKGDVDERSITEIRPHELSEYTQCHFFAGIGGWPLALELAGWPATRPVWTGSCPCQPFSSAGQGKGGSDDRHLWPVFRRLIAKLHPERVFGEQVAQAIGFDWLDGVSADLEADGYAVGAAVLGAHSVGAPHIRQRLYWVADAGDQRHRSERDSKAGIGQFKRDSANGWRIVSFARDCEGYDHETGELGDICSICGLDYCDECKCPGPTEDEYEYEERGGDLYARRMVLPSESGLQGHAGNGDHRDQPGRLGEDSYRPIAKAGGAVSAAVVLANSYGRQQGQPTTSPTRYRNPTESAVSWDSYAIVHCRDGKARRFEPGSFPLAHGLPGRVGLLRGYGNAIVPQVAAEFIQAFLEI